MRTVNFRFIIAVTVGFVMVEALPCLYADSFFGEPVNLGSPINSTFEEGGITISPDGLTLYFSSARPGGYGSHDLYVTTRSSLDDLWSEPVNLGPSVNTAQSEGWCTISSDGLTLIFSELCNGTIRSGGIGGRDLWIMTRPDISSSWSVPTNMGTTVNSSRDDVAPSLSSDGLSLFFASDRPGSKGIRDLWFTQRADKSSPWNEPINLGTRVNSGYVDSHPSISSDGLVLFFSSMRRGNYDVYMTKRAAVGEPWSKPENLGPSINNSGVNGGPLYWQQGHTLIFTSERSGMGGFDFWQSQIEVIVDFTGDGQVGMPDLLRLIESWGQNEPLCDIGPTPFGDGTVDESDLEVLMGYWEQKVDDPTLVAHWPLDETNGTVAFDDAGGNDAYVMGNAVWQSNDGQVDGALLFDGVDDFISAPSIINAADGPFSVFVWIKGGAAGQAVISEPGRSDWLSFDLLTANLKTELKGPGRNSRNLFSETTITNDKWHRIGFVWDGFYRSLYVDSIAVAEDTQDSLENTANSLYIGTGKDMAPDTFFSGLIDDIRIYNRAITP